MAAYGLIALIPDLEVAEFLSRFSLELFPTKSTRFGL